MVRRSFGGALLCVLAFLATSPASAQQSGGNDALRVTVSQNNDGSTTTYEMDPANRKATATTVSAAGKPVSKTRYVLDDVGRFTSGEVLGPGDKLQFKTRYKYDASGRLWEETRLTSDDVVTMKLVYAYDEKGRPAGYAVYDGSGKLLGQTRAAAPSAPAASQGAKPRRNPGR